MFEKPRTRSIDGEEDPFAIHHLSLCPESRLLAVAGATAHVLLFKFTKQETTAAIPVCGVRLGKGLWVIFVHNFDGECHFFVVQLSLSNENGISQTVYIHTRTHKHTHT